MGILWDVQWVFPLGFQWACLLDFRLDFRLGCQLGIQWGCQLSG